ncbi:MAG: DUF389 domain-containing protein [Bacteroidales bacterium]|nr:DUF389 domain-containing protein [Bacteroidales bacterium]
MRFNHRQLKTELGRYFNLLSDKEDELAVVEQVRGGIAFRGTNLWILIFAIFIASLGLNVNSTAVIIGAMLISPLMGPIIGMGLSVGIGDTDMFKQALKNYGVATLISVLTATLYFLISPLSEARSELLARTSPTLYDVFIAFFGGAAGVLALTTKSKGQVIPGVAIATALMPPLCTAGYGLATAQWSYFFGAFYLFFINTVFIATATFLGVKLLRFHSLQPTNTETARRSRRVITVVFIVTLIPAAVLTVSIVRQDVQDRNVAQFVRSELNFAGTQVLSTRVEHDTLCVVAVGKEITDEEADVARERMKFYRLSGYGLSIIQADNTGAFAMVSNLSLAEQANGALSSQVADLQRQLETYRRFDTLSVHVNEEARVLFGPGRTVSVGRIGGKTMAVVDRGSASLSEAEREKMAGWLVARVGDSSTEVVFK